MRSSRNARASGSGGGAKRWALRCSAAKFCAREVISTCPLPSFGRYGAISEGVSALSRISSQRSFAASHRRAACAAAPWSWAAASGRPSCPAIGREAGDQIGFGFRTNEEHRPVVLPVAVGELDRGLRLADAAQAADRRDLAERGAAAGCELRR